MELKSTNRKINEHCSSFRFYHIRISCSSANSEARNDHLERLVYASNIARNLLGLWNRYVSPCYFRRIIIDRNIDEQPHASGELCRLRWSDDDPG